MDIELRVLPLAMAMLFVVGMAIYLFWKLLEPRREGESRSLIDLVFKPAAVMAGGVIFLGICMIFPQVLGWTLGVLTVAAVISFIRSPAKERLAIAEAVHQPNPRSKRATARFLIAVFVVFGVLGGLLSYLVPL